MHFGFHIFSNHFPLALYSLLFPERQYAKPEGTVTVYHLAEGGGGWRITWYTGERREDLLSVTEYKRGTKEN